MLLQAALNGARTPQEHPAVPISTAQLAADAVACTRVGAGAVHLHPRDASGAESLDASVVDPAVRAVRAACGLPVGVSTGAWIEPDLERRCALVRAWREPDYASVNLGERGSDAVMRALLDAGVGIEAGVWDVGDADRLAASGLADRVLRVLVEPVDVGVDEAVRVVDAIHASLDRMGIDAPRLQHGDGDATWVLIADAARRGSDTRVGLEDTLRLPDGREASGNAELVREARSLGVAGLGGM